MENNNHTWSFSTVGGVKRVNLESGADLLALESLDQKLWTALSCPVNGLEIDAKTLELIDTDKDGQIRVPEILEAVKWIMSILKNPNDLLKQEEVLPLNAINTGTEQGMYLLKCAQIILTNLGKKDANTISVEDTVDFTKIFAATPFNGDGIITEDSCENDDLKKLIAEIILCVGSKDDRGGKLGVDQALVDSFFDQCTQYAAWQLDSQANTQTILPLEQQTDAAYEAWQAVKHKIEDYYLRCKLAAFDPQTTDTLNQLTARVEFIAAKDLSECHDEISNYPLAKIEAGKAMPLSTGINPSWETAMQTFKASVVDVVLPGKSSLTEADYLSIVAKLTPYGTWKTQKAGTAVEQLGIERINELLGSDVRNVLNQLIAQDTDLADEAESMIVVDKLVRYYRDLFRLLKNFVTFFDFYTPGSKAIFQAGTLYIDQRSCTLCIRVNDMAKHDSMVALSGMFLIYCKCVSKSSGQEMIIVAALTNGDIDNLIVGRNAVFYDRTGLDWDATVIKIVDNPISIRQAFWTPYRKVSRFIETQVNKFAAAQDNKVQSQATESIEKKAAAADAHASKSVAAPSAPATVNVNTAPPPPPFDVGKFVGIFAAISLALGAIGAAIASIVAGFMALTWWKMPLAVLGIIMLISGPAMIMAYLKLRKRNLAPILDANGWAINAKATVNISFGNLLTQIASLPLNSRVNLNDPFSKKGVPIWKIVLGAMLMASATIYILFRLGILGLW
ncbi:MAG: hypothetical protein CFE21_04130 [Bacteroidetes bacterium B1(2017)]|nr:MAG: hypothetical protein CFE21_04130 [Bacteroidetes bacterium B1(2017)]